MQSHEVFPLLVNYINFLLPRLLFSQSIFFAKMTFKLDIHNI